MTNLKILCLITLLTVILSTDCGPQQPTEEELVRLSVECFNTKYNPDIHDGDKLSRMIESRVVGYKKILQHIKMHKIKHTETSPVIKWAQTKQKIFVNFKLSHRQDSPPCSDVRNQHFFINNVLLIQAKISVQKNYDDTNTSKFDFMSECFFTDQKLMYKLSMTFNATLKSILIDKQGFGTYTIVGEKQQPQIWIDPFEDVHRAAIWQEMRERYDKQMNQYFELREKRLEQQQLRSKPKRRKKPVVKQAQTKQTKETVASEQL